MVFWAVYCILAWAVTLILLLIAEADNRKLGNQNRILQQQLEVVRENERKATDMICGGDS
jgi:hypothetical protein